MFCSKGKVGSEGMEGEPLVNRHQMVAVGMPPPLPYCPGPQGSVRLVAMNLQGKHASPGQGGLEQILPSSAASFIRQCW